jgi:hypothetical protein
MPFIGNQPALSYTSFAKQDFTTSATTSYTLDNPVANANELALFINFVRQEPTTAYSASGTSLTLTSATSATDDMYCVFLGKAVQTVNPPNGSVGASQIVDASITSGKLASGVLPDNTPAFSAYLSADQSIANDTFVKVNFNTEIFDTDNTYDNSTNYRFTPAVVGKYLINTGVRFNSGVASNLQIARLALYKNGSHFYEAQNHNTSNQPLRQWLVLNVSVDVTSTSDYFEIFAYLQAVSTTTGLTISGKGGGGDSYAYYNAFKILT